MFLAYILHNMKIFIIDTSGRGGICHYTYSLSQALSLFEKDITLITTKNYELNLFERNFHIMNVLPTHYQRKYKFAKGIIYFRSLMKILSIALNNRPQIIHFHQIKMPFIELLFYKIMQLKNIKLIITLHDVKPFEYKIISPFLRYLYNIVDCIIVHSKKDVDLLEGFISENIWDKIQIIHHGEYAFLSKNITKEDARNLLGIDINKKVLLFFGYIRRYKGLDILLKAINILKRKRSDILLIIAGKEIEPFTGYQKMIDELDIGENIIKKIGYIPINECSLYFSSADVVVLPYREIYQSGVVFLSYGHSRPVMVTNVGAFSEAVEDGKSGFIVEPENPSELAGKIDYIYSSGVNLDEMGRYGFQMAQKKFSWKSSAEKTYNVYKNLSNI